MANKKQLEILKQGVVIWNKWRSENPIAVVNLHESDLNGIDLNGVHLAEADLSNTDLRWASLSEANLDGANLGGARLSNADLGDANLSRANLIGANLRDAYLVYTNFFEAILTGANLCKADLVGAIFKKADLRDANLTGANLKHADLSEANLSRADLSGANMGEASLRKADLSWADLSEAGLSKTNLCEANLKGTKFRGSILEYTILGTVDLSEAIDIEIIFHHGPSSIGIDTIYLSKGKIPEVFLRGCGLSDLQIETAKLANPSLDPEQVTDITYKIHQLYLGSGIQYYSCFISYSSKDEKFAKYLHDDLQNNGVRCWFASEDMKIGDQIRPTIDRQIRLRDKLLVILSENSVKSEWVGDEVEGAIEEESKSNRLVLFPIRLDDTVLNTRDDWAAKIKRRRHIGDFSNWQDKNSYQKALERLLRDLKATGEQKT